MVKLIKTGKKNGIAEVELVPSDPEINIIKIEPKKKEKKKEREYIKGGVSLKNRQPIKKPTSVKEEKELNPGAYKKYKGGGLAGMRRFNRGGKV